MYGQTRTVHQLFDDNLGGDAELIDEVVFAETVEYAAIDGWLFYVGGVGTKLGLQGVEADVVEPLAGVLYGP